MKRQLLGKGTPWLETNIFNLLMEIAKAKGVVLAAEVYQAKELEYAALASGTEPEPQIRFVELSNIPALRSRLARSVWENPRTITRSVALFTEVERTRGERKVLTERYVDSSIILNLQKRLFSLLYVPILIK
jgi:hypothetical protein